MKQVIYIDVLLLTNFLVGYLILISTSAILKTNSPRWRTLCGALAGSLFSLTVFLPDTSPLVILPVRLIVFVIVLLISFGFKDLRRYLRCFAAFIGVNMVFAGMMLALWFVFEPNNMIYSNGAVYFDIGFLTLTVSAVVCYAAVFLLSRLVQRKAPSNKIFSVNIGFLGKEVHAQALLDMGNLLTDSFSGKPVIIIEEHIAKRLLSPEGYEYITTQFTSDTSRLSSEQLCRMRLIPCDTVIGGGIIPAFCSDKLTIKNGKKTESFSGIPVGVVGTELSNGEYSVLLNPMLFSQAEAEVSAVAKA